MLFGPFIIINKRNNLTICVLAVKRGHSFDGVASKSLLLLDRCRSIRTCNQKIKGSALLSDLGFLPVSWNHHQKRQLLLINNPTCLPLKLFSAISSSIFNLYNFHFAEVLYSTNYFPNYSEIFFEDLCLSRRPWK